MSSRTYETACADGTSLAELAQGNVSYALALRALEQPADLAVAIARRSGGFEEVTFAELEGRTAAWIAELHARGVRRDDRVALMVPPSVDFFALTFALLRMGAVLVMIDPGMGLRGLRRCLEQASPRAFVGIRKAVWARRLLGWAPHAEIVVRVPSGASSSDDSGPTLELTAPDDSAAVLFTSGSTGPAKGALYTHRMFLAQVRALREHWGIEPGERDLATFPLFALFGPALGMSAVVPLMDASRPGRADPARLWQALDQYQCTNLFASPALIEKLGTFCQQRRLRLSSLRRALSAGAPANLPSLERFASSLPEGVEVFTPYGATESLPVSSIGSRELLVQTRAATESGAGICVGRPLGGVEVKILPISDDELPHEALERPLEDGQIGEIVVRSTQTSPEYFDRAEATRRAKIVHPQLGLWHRMGDVGWLDEQGRLWMCGRLGHRVRTASAELYTLPVEALFNQHPEVARTALVGVGPDARQTPVLWIEAKKRLSRADRRRVTSELRELGRTDPRSALVEQCLFHRRFPVDVRHNAKIFREELAKQAQRRLRAG